MITDSMFPNKESGFHSTPVTSAIFGFGIEGLRDRVQRGQNNVSFYPAVPPNSKRHPGFAKAMEMEAEYTDFIERYEKIVLVSFGTMFVPTDEQMNLLTEALKLSDPT